MRTSELLLLFLFVSLTGCTMKKEADLILRNARIYTVNDAFSVAEAIAIKDGKILAIGKTNEILNHYTSNQVIDVQAKTIYPGFIDAHCHFVSYGLSLNEPDFTGTMSFNEVLERLVESASGTTGWIVGRGWDQNDWQINEFPTRVLLDSLFPDRPVLIKRIDGHAALANQVALEMSQIDAATTVEGGVLIKENGVLTGMLIDNAIGLVERTIPVANKEQYNMAIKNAEQQCLSVGLTTVDDAGLDQDAVALIDSMQEEGVLKLRVYAMLNPSEENFSHYEHAGPLIKDRLTVRSFKFYADGALGSRGAALKKPYHDDPGNKGLLLSSPTDLLEQAGIIYDMGFQMNTHCIGDSANKLILDIYGDILKGQNDRRWRIEHAQILDTADIPAFGKYNIIPSVQPTHCTSDMYWAEERLGKERLPGAYAYRALLAQNGMIASGSDFPVESINPLLGFYAAVARKDLKGYPEGGFLAANGISREQALRAMTIWAAMANFSEAKVGSLEPGKNADLVILDRDIMTGGLEDIESVQVLHTYINGEEVYRAP